jgi:uncharacterized protein (TIGR02271 family)
MANRERNNLNERGARNTAGAGVAPLSKLDDYEIADGYPDIRGWAVNEGGRKVGNVHELLVDTSELRVRYLDIELDRGIAGAGGDRHVLVPVGNVSLDDRRDDVVLRGISAAQLSGLAPYGHAGLTREYETLLLNSLGLASAGTSGAAFYGAQHFDDSQLFTGRPRPTRAAGDAQITRAEEELAVGKRTVQAGQVGVRKTVETERVQEQVPVLREEVEIERRPIDAASDVGRVEVRADEIRVPLMAEEVVAEKRVVPKEQLIIRKRAVTEQRTVEADVRKERIEVENQTARGARATRARDEEARP